VNVPFSTVTFLHKEIKEEMLLCFERIYDKGWFIQGEECNLFEKEFAEYIGAKHCVGMGNGLDAIYLTLKALGIGPGDEVIIPSNTFIATALAVTYTGASPVLIDPDIRTYNICANDLEKGLSDKTKAYVPSEYCANSLKNAGLLYNLGRLKFGISDYALNVEQNDNQEAVTFLMVGAIDYRKAHDVLINALNYIDKGVIKKAQFIIIGSVNDLEIHKVCMAAKDKYGNVFLHDSMPREEVLHWYSKADCLLLPSREDPLPVVAIEAMMCSLPAVCSDQTGTADYITHYENGLIFPSEDAKALAEHITYAIAHRDKMAQMGRKARTDIYEKYFTMEKFRESILNAIDEVM